MQRRPRSISLFTASFVVLAVIATLCLIFLVSDIGMLWQRPSHRTQILRAAPVGTAWSDIEKFLAANEFEFSAPSKDYGPDMTRFINVDRRGSYTLDFLERIGMFNDRRAWVVLTFDASDRVKSVKIEYPD